MVFESDDTWGIWMKDMKVPIDIIWLDNEKGVIYIVKNASPESSTDKIYKSTEDARYVIELSAGSVQKYGISVGQKAEFEVNK